jgi:formate dehydrogenase iron-sulfur subunit
VSCPFGVVQKNEEDGRAFKCTFCTDRQKAGLEPACAKACPTESIKFGRLDDLRAETSKRMEVLRGRGMTDARVYDPTDTSVKGIHSIFIIRGEPETYNLPPKPEVPTIYLKEGWRNAAIEAVAMVAAVATSFLVWRNAKGNGRV